VNAIQKPLSSSKNALQKPHETFQGFLVADLLSFTQNLMQARCSILPSITPSQTKQNMKSKKHS
jgi:hypothetical protein